MVDINNFIIKSIRDEKYIDLIVRLGRRAEDNFDSYEVLKDYDTVKTYLIESNTYEDEGILGIFIDNILIGYGAVWINGQNNEKAEIDIILDRDFIIREVVELIYRRLEKYSKAKGVEKQYIRLRENQEMLISYFDGLGFRIDNTSWEMQIQTNKFIRQSIGHDDLKATIITDIHKTEEHYIRDIVDLMNDGFRSNKDDEKYTIEKIIEMYECIDMSIVVKKNGIAIGLGSIKNDRENDIGYLCNIVVKKEYRGNYIGRWVTRKLVELVKEIMRRSKVILTVNIKNTSAINVYQSIGFNISDEIMTYSKQISYE